MKLKLMKILMLLLFITETSINIAWADPNYQIIITVPKLVISGDSSASPIDFFIKSLRVCVTKPASASQFPCPYPNTADTSSGQNLTWSCVNFPNCLYTSLVQSPNAQTSVTVNNNTIVLNYGNPNGTMIPILQTTVKPGWNCQISSDQKTVTCSAPPPPIPTCNTYLGGIGASCYPCATTSGGCIYNPSDGSIDCSSCTCNQPPNC